MTLHLWVIVNMDGRRPAPTVFVYKYKKSAEMHLSPLKRAGVFKEAKVIRFDAKKEQQGED